MHPGDHAHAAVVGVRREDRAADLLRRRQHRLVDDPDGDRGGAVERRGDLRACASTCRDRVLAVEVLAAGEEPDRPAAEGLVRQAPASSIACAGLGIEEVKCLHVDVERQPLARNDVTARVDASDAVRHRPCR